MRDPHIASLDYISLENMLSRHCEKAQTMSWSYLMLDNSAGGGGGGAVKEQKGNEDRQTKRWEDNKKNCTWQELVNMSREM